MRDEAIRRRLEIADQDSELEEDEDSDAEMDEGGPETCYIVPITGARVTRSNAKSLLFHYCNKLPSDKYAAPYTHGNPISPSTYLYDSCHEICLAL